MRITINPVLVIETMEWERRIAYEWGGHILLLKGDPTAQAAEAQQSQFDQQLMGIFQSQYQQQTSILNYLNGKMQTAINGQQGYTPAQLTAQRTSASDTTAQGAANAQAAANAAAVRTGGSALPSGVSAQIESSIGTQAAQQDAAEQNAITTNNANLQQQNFWQAANVLGGTAAQFSPLGYSQGATSGAGAVAGLSNAVTNANGPGIGQILGGLAGGALSGLASPTSFLNTSGNGVLNAIGGSI